MYVVSKVDSNKGKLVSLAVSDDLAEAEEKAAEYRAQGYVSMVYWSDTVTYETKELSE